MKCGKGSKINEAKIAHLYLSDRNHSEVLQIIFKLNVCLQLHTVLQTIFFLRSIKVTKGNNSTLTKDVIVHHSSVNSQEHVLNKKLEAQNMICDTAFQKRKIIIFRLRPPCCCCCCCFCC